MSIFSTGLKHLNKHTKVVPVFLTINNAYAPYAAAAIHSLTQRVNKKRYYRVIMKIGKCWHKKPMILW